LAGYDEKSHVQAMRERRNLAVYFRTGSASYIEYSENRLSHIFGLKADEWYLEKGSKCLTSFQVRRMLARRLYSSQCCPLRFSKTRAPSLPSTARWLTALSGAHPQRCSKPATMLLQHCSTLLKRCSLTVLQLCTALYYVPLCLMAVRSALPVRAHIGLFPAVCLLVPGLDIVTILTSGALLLSSLDQPGRRSHWVRLVDPLR
jgi:hypothetical protein